MALPDFFVAGAPKAGTTALHAALAQHPELYLSPVKEPKFFLTDGPPPPTQGGPGDAKTYREHVWRRRDYEAALCRRAARHAARRVDAVLPLQPRCSAPHPGDSSRQARLIIVLRDPIERAHSNWTHLWSAGLDPIDDFVRACAAEDQRVAAGWADFWHYKRIGLYGQQVEHLYSVFPREQVLVFRYRDLVEDPPGTLDRICGLPGRPPGRDRSRAARERHRAPRADPAAPGYRSRLLRAASAVTTRLPGHPGRYMHRPAGESACSRARRRGDR